MLDLVTNFFADASRLERASVSWARRTSEAPEAAVLIPVTRDAEEPEIVFIKRAEHMNSHSGEVAFPGGKTEEGDADSLFTALRETHEEIALPPDQVDVLGPLPTRTTRFLITVAPFVGLIEKNIPLEANPDELDAVFRVPVSYLLNKENLTKAHFSGRGYSFMMPCYIFEGYRIWGFTLGLLADFLNDVFDAGIILEYPPEVVALEMEGKSLDGRSG